MPFCIKCGGQVKDGDKFCGNCGSVQEEGSGSSTPPNSGPAKTQDWLGGIPPRTAALMCYIPVVGWIGSVIVLASERFRHDAETRFHAFQGLYLFVVYLIVEMVLGPFLVFEQIGFRLAGLLKLTLIGTWVFLMIKTSQGEVFRLPILGELADRSVSEQR